MPGKPAWESGSWHFGRTLVTNACVRLVSDSSQTPAVGREGRLSSANRVRDRCQAFATLSIARHISSVVPSPQSDVARCQRLRADHRLVGLRVVERARDAHRVCGRDLDRRLQVVDVLPVEDPGRDVQQRSLLRRPGVEDDRDVAAAQVHVAGDAVDRLRRARTAGARRRDRRAGSDVGRVVGERLAAEPQERVRREGGLRAVLRDLVLQRPRAGALRARDAGRARQLDRRRDQVRLQRGSAVSSPAGQRS